LSVLTGFVYCFGDLLMIIGFSHFQFSRMMTSQSSTCYP